jgi:hypothetical protein
MKKIITPLLLMGILLAMGIQSASAQFQFIDDSSNSTPTPEPAVAKRALISFHKMFEGASEPEWFMANRNYVVNFTQNHQKCKAEFTPAGWLLYRITYCKEKQLPLDLRKSVKSLYFDYTINSAIKIEYKEQVVWIVNLEDSDNLLVLRVEDGDVDTLKDVKKLL